MYHQHHRIKVSKGGRTFAFSFPNRNNVNFITETKLDIQPIAGTGTNLEERQYDEITPPTTAVNFEIDDRQKQTVVPAATQQQQQSATNDLTSTSTVSTSKIIFRVSVSYVPKIVFSSCVCSKKII